MVVRAAQAAGQERDRVSTRTESGHSEGLGHRLQRGRRSSGVVGVLVGGLVTQKEAGPLGVRMPRIDAK